MRAFLLSCVLASALVACVRSVPPAPAPAAPPAAIVIPAGCSRELSGAWVHAEEPEYRYLGEDDGGTLTLLAVRGADAGEVARIVLSRTPKGFIGATHSNTSSASGQQCPVEFPTEVIACPNSGLVIQTTTTASIDESCRPAVHAAGATPVVQHTLMRPARPDAGLPAVDAGSMPSDGGIAPPSP